MFALGLVFPGQNALQQRSENGVKPAMAQTKGKLDSLKKTRGSDGFTGSGLDSEVDRIGWRINKKA